MSIRQADLFEWGYVGAFLVLLLHLGLGTALDHSLVHDIPYGISASDGFGDLAFVEGVKENGNYKTIPGYIRAGFDDTLGFHMPVYYHLVAIFTYTTGLETWDALLVVAFFFSLMAVLGMYMLIRSVNKHLALLSLPLSVFLYVPNFSIIYSFGVWDLIVACFFMVCALWALYHMHVPHVWLFFGLFSAAVVVTHISEAIFLALFTLCYAGYALIRKKHTLKDMLFFGASGIFALFLTWYYLIIFKVGYARDGVQNTLDFIAPTANDVILGHFGLAKWLLILAIPLGLYLGFTKKKYDIAFIGLFLFVIGYTNYISSFASRAFQVRYLWPVYLMILFGLLLYFIVQLVYSSVSLAKGLRLLATIGISIALSLTFVLAYYSAQPNPGLANPYHWGAMEWVSANTEPDARLLYFYGDVYNAEAFLWNQKRLSYRVKANDLGNALNQGQIKRSYVAEVAAADDVGLLYRKSFFSFGYHGEEYNNADYSGPQDMCTFDYLVFDKQGAVGPLAQYNLLIAQRLIERESIEAVYDNAALVILKNSAVGEDCIEDQQFQ